MPASGASIPDLPYTIRRFARDAALIARLCREDATFLCVCEEYELAAGMLARLLEKGGREANACEYLELALELECEITAMLRNAD